VLNHLALPNAVFGPRNVPLIANAENYVSLATGKAGSNRQKVKSFVIRADTLANWLWSQRLAVRLDLLDDGPLVVPPQEKRG
jgi:hypothetical protein